jgi:hypothetical protein
MQGTRGRRRRCKQLIDDLKGTIEDWKLKEEVLDRNLVKSLWKMSWTVLIQAAEWMDEWKRERIKELMAPGRLFVGACVYLYVCMYVCMNNEWTNGCRNDCWSMYCVVKYVRVKGSSQQHLNLTADVIWNTLLISCIYYHQCSAWKSLITWNSVYEVWQ